MCVFLGIEPPITSIHNDLLRNTRNKACKMDSLDDVFHVDSANRLLHGIKGMISIRSIHTCMSNVVTVCNIKDDMTLCSVNNHLMGWATTIVDGRKSVDDMINGVADRDNN